MHHSIYRQFSSSGGVAGNAITYSAAAVANISLAAASYLDTFTYFPTKYVGNGPGFNGNINNIPIPDVPIEVAQINHPRGLSADYLGNLYFADEYNGSVRVITPNAAGQLVVRTIVGTGVEAGSAEPPNGVLAQGIELYEPMAIDTSAFCRYVVFLNTDSHLVQLLDMEHPAGFYEQDVFYRGALIHAAGDPYLAGPWLTTIAGQYVLGSAGAYYEPPDHDALKARFNNPQGVAITDDANTIYVADTENNVIRKLTRNANGLWSIERLAGSPSATAGYGGNGGPALNALLNNPVGIDLDASERNLYIADMNNQRIRKIDLQTGIITTVAGNGGIAPNQFTNVNDGTTATLGAPLNQVALFKFPSDVALDVNGNLYVADMGNNRIRKIRADLGEIETIYGNGTPALIQAPRGVAVNWAGEVFASDTEGAKIWRLTPDGLTPENYPPAPPCRGTTSAETSVTLQAEKTATGRPLMADQFVFGVFDMSGNLIAIASNDGSGKIVFPEIVFMQPGTFAYTVREISQEGNGWITDPTAYTAIVTVTPNGAGQLSADVQYQGGAPIFTNTYKATPTEVSLAASKAAVGAPLPGGRFSFGLFDDNGNLLASAENDANGNISFPPLFFTEPGMHSYTVRELSPSGGGWTTDSTVYPVTITVLDNGLGQLEATVNYPAGNPSFTDNFNSTPTSDV
ncbi:MAG: hypothetical protein LBU67_05985, partial [Oscillospiraceae bacterium]|nr:hypothetical protein [Oscillospiraceae bacterium]